MGIHSLSEYSAAFDRIAPILLDTAARSVVIIGLTGVAALIMRRASAAARHWIWLLGFAGLLLLPILTTTLPGWRVLPRLDMNDGAPLVSGIIVEPPVPADTSPAQSLVRSEQSPTNVTSERPDVAQQQTSQPIAAAQSTGRTSAPDQATSMQMPQRAALPWTFWPVAIWLIGSLLVLGHLSLGYLSLWLLQRRCARISKGEWPRLLGQLQEELQVHRAVQLLSSPLRTMPMTWGLWRTRLLLPEQSNCWPADQRRAVLLHELSHVMRCDCLTQFLAQIGCALYWFNPLVWIAWRRMQVERERACDDLVLNAGEKASSYAEHLLHSASSMPTHRFIGAAALAMARASTLEERLRAILDAQRNRRALTFRSALATILLLMVAVVPVAALRAQDNPAPVPASARGADAAQATTAPATEVQVRNGGFGPGMQPIGQVPGEGPTCALDATIYDLRLPGDAISRLDLDALTRASATTESFEKALADLGAAKSLYRANQNVRLAHDSVVIGRSEPYVAGLSYSRDGQAIQRIAYSNVGVVFDMVGKAGAADSINLYMNIEVSGLYESPTEITGGTQASLFHRVTMSHKGAIKAGQPFVVISADAASMDASGKALAYIARVTLSAPQPATGAARGD